MTKGLHPGGPASKGGLHPSGLVCIWGVGLHWGGCLHLEGGLADPPLRYYGIQAVRILLECILVDAISMAAAPIQNELTGEKKVFANGCVY